MNRVIVLSILLLNAIVGKSQPSSNVDSTVQKQFENFDKNGNGMFKYITYPIGQAHPIKITYVHSVHLNSGTSDGLIKIKDDRKYAGFEKPLSIQESVSFIQGLDSLLKIDFNNGCAHETTYSFASSSGLLFFSECDGTGWNTKLVLDTTKPEWAIKCDKGFLHSLRQLLRFAIESADHYKSIK
ncbi:MAG: hypothetical protein KBH11_04675 [Bacteroidia bacterium]|nr:hypothetical protein [Bacteroidia bacterium]